MGRAESGAAQGGARTVARRGGGAGGRRGAGGVVVGGRARALLLAPAGLARAQRRICASIEFQELGARRAGAREREVRGARTVERGVGEVDGFLLLPLLAFLLLLLLIRAIRRALIKPESIMLAGYFRRWPFSAVLH